MRRKMPGLKLFLLLAFAAAFLAGGCASERYARPSEGTVQRGIASWYGPGFHGRPTASGEIYDMDALTAAHRELPLGTILDVENLENGRTVRVRVNDRGPYIRGRVLDLSRGAARKLDMVNKGLAKVELRVIEVGQGRAGPSRLTRYTVQVGAYREYDNALAVQEKLRQSGDNFPVKIYAHKDVHRVRVGIYSKRTEAEDIRRRLARLGFDAAIVPIY